MIFSGGFKQFNSTLTKTIIQTGSSSRPLKRLSVQSWEPKINWSPKYFKICPSLPRVSQTLEGVLYAVYKISKDKPSDV